MSTTLLLITHNDLGSVLLETASKMFGSSPMRSQSLTVTERDDPELLRSRAQGMLEELQQNGEGVLVLTDMFGSTPANIACALQREGTVAVVAGVNLPMLVRVLNYPLLPLRELVEKALSGGRDGVIFCQGEKP